MLASTQSNEPRTPGSSPARGRRAVVDLDRQRFSRPIYHPLCNLIQPGGSIHISTGVHNPPGPPATTTRLFHPSGVTRGRNRAGPTSTFDGGTVGDRRTAPPARRSCPPTEPTSGTWASWSGTSSSRRALHEGLGRQAAPGARRVPSGRGEGQRNRARESPAPPGEPEWSHDQRWGAARGARAATPRRRPAPQRSAARVCLRITTGDLAAEFQAGLDAVSHAGPVIGGSPRRSD
jgi:hypothetical protein